MRTDFSSKTRDPCWIRPGLSESRSFLQEGPLVVNGVSLQWPVTWLCCINITCVCVWTNKTQHSSASHIYFMIQDIQTGGRLGFLSGHKLKASQGFLLTVHSLSCLTPSLHSENLHHDQQTDKRRLGAADNQTLFFLVADQRTHSDVSEACGGLLRSSETEMAQAWKVYCRAKLIYANIIIFSQTFVSQF